MYRHLQNYTKIFFALPSRPLPLFVLTLQLWGARLKNSRRNRFGGSWSGKKREEGFVGNWAFSGSKYFCPIWEEERRGALLFLKRRRRKRRKEGRRTKGVKGEEVKIEGSLHSSRFAFQTGKRFAKKL